MNETYTAVFNADRRQLATLFGAAIGSAERLWLDEELGSNLLHQLATPIQVDLVDLDKGSAVKTRLTLLG